MNILILSSGSRNKIVEYLKKEGKVVATDCSPYAPSLYAADNYYIVPRISDSMYLKSILEICEKEDIDVAFSLIDPEITLLAKNRDSFSAIGVDLMVSPLDMVELALDKYKMYQYLKENNICTPKTYSSQLDFEKAYSSGEINFPVFVKPQEGSASNEISKVETLSELVTKTDTSGDTLIIQQYIDGKEYGVDAYVDMISGELIELFIKEKLVMRAGETDKSISVHHQGIKSLVTDFVEKTNYRGVIDIDIFEENGCFYLSEVNPRFGGGYPHAYESGVNYIKYIINNISGKKNLATNDYHYEQDIIMMKYSELITFKEKNE